jgi:hypothetical protein
MVLRWLKGLQGRLFGGYAPADTSPPNSDWCLVGNIVEEHELGESRQIVRGSKHFTPGTKVYCLPPQWGDGYEKVVVVGIARGSRRWISVVLSANLVTNWRARVVYQPTALRRLRQGIDGFNRQWKSREEVETWVELLRSRQDQL